MDRENRSRVIITIIIIILLVILGILGIIIFRFFNSAPDV